MIQELFQATQSNKIEELERILHMDSELVNKENEEGHTPLGYAAHFGNKEAVQLLLHYGANVNAVSHSKIHYIPSNTALHAAITGERNVEVIRLLLKNGARTTILDSNGQTSLHSAAYHGNSIEIINLLIEHGSLLDVKDSQGKNAYEIVIEQGNSHVAEVLRQNDK